MYGFSETNTQGRVCGSQVSLVVCAMLLRTTNTTKSSMYKYDMQFVNRVSISVHLILRVKLFAEPRPQMSETISLLRNMEMISYQSCDDDISAM